MAQDDDEALYDSFNNLISAIKNHESRIIRLEEKQDQLEKHLDRLTKQMVLGIKQNRHFLIFLELQPTRTRYQAI